MLNDERILNQASKFRLNNILPPPPFTEKHKRGKIADLASFRQFLSQKGVKFCLICILTPDLESSQHQASLRTPFIIIFTF